MIKKLANRIVGFCCVLLLISSCKSTKEATGFSSVDNLSEMDYLEKVIIGAPGFESFSSKMKLTLVMDGKQVSVSGSMKMKKDELMQLSIAPILGIEVARIEISKENILIIDRMNKQYVDVPISELSMFANTKMDYYTLQALFYNQLFIPGQKEIAFSDLILFAIKRTDSESIIRIKEGKKLNYSFTTRLNDASLVSTRINTATNNLSWQYSDFKPIDKAVFPTQMNISFQGTGKLVRAEINFSRIDTGKNNLSKTTVSGKYTQIDSKDLLKQLLNL